MKYARVGSKQASEASVPTLSSLPFCTGVQFSRHSIRAFNDIIKIGLNSRLEIQSYWVLLVATWSISNRAVFTWTSNRKRLFVFVFPRFALGACNCFKFWLVHCLVRVVSDWLEWLFWFWFSDTQSETARRENWTNWTSHIHLIKYGINSGRSLDVSLEREFERKAC